MNNSIKNIKHVLKRGYKSLDNIFTDKEAWMLFRVAAFAETISWILLLIGIYFSAKSLPGHDSVLAVSGSIHGIIYIFYIFIVVFAHQSLKWGVWRFIISGIVSSFPFGALIFELWEAKRRNKLVKA